MTQEREAATLRAQELSDQVQDLSMQLEESSRATYRLNSEIQKFQEHCEDELAYAEGRIAELDQQLQETQTFRLEVGMADVRAGLRAALAVNSIGGNVIWTQDVWCHLSRLEQQHATHPSGIRQPTGSTNLRT